MVEKGETVENFYIILNSRILYWHDWVVFPSESQNYAIHDKLFQSFAAGTVHSNAAY